MPMSILTHAILARLLICKTWTYEVNWFLVAQVVIVYKYYFRFRNCTKFMFEYIFVIYLFIRTMHEQYILGVCKCMGIVY